MPNVAVKEIVAAIIGVGLGACMLLFVKVGAGVPESQKLEAVSGTVSWIERHRYGVHSRLSGDSRAFDYLSKGRARLVLSNKPLIQDDPSR
jgi:hypothetical protein